MAEDVLTLEGDFGDLAIRSAATSIEQSKELVDEVCFGSIADVRKLIPATNMASVFVYGVMPWSAHFFPKTFGRL